MSSMEQTGAYRDLSEALAGCKTFAERGHDLAIGAVSLLRRVAETVSEELREEISRLEASAFNDDAITGGLAAQLSAIRSGFETVPLRLSEDINALSKTSFSITLFGRTMAGKSTLMEILTHGNGEAIGKGAQRTTRDVRAYSYKGLRITDVPGIAAFEGEEDEGVAFDAAKKCDLILFLITDDAPQANEAECLKRVLGLGKPVICIINVKAGINAPADMKMFRRDIGKKFDDLRLRAIKEQFLGFGDKYGQDWRTIRFACAHLKSAFLSRQRGFEEDSEELYGLSRFEHVEDLIVGEVCRNGSFYKLKAFADAVVAPACEALETLYAQSAENSVQGTVLGRKKRKLEEWAEGFESGAVDRIEALLTSVSVELKAEIASFAENNYANPNAGAAWDRALGNHCIEQRASGLLKQLAMECDEELSEISREISAEIKFYRSSFSGDSIDMHMLVDGKRIWNWTTKLLSGGLIMASLFNVWNPVGWIGLGIGIMRPFGLLLFRDREKKALAARQELEEKLSGQIDIGVTGLRQRMLDGLDHLKRQLEPMIRAIGSVSGSVFTLSKLQRESATSLNDKLQEINEAVIKEGLAYLGYGGLNGRVLKVVRRPGYSTVVVLEGSGPFPAEATEGLAHLLKEEVCFAPMMK